MIVRWPGVAAEGETAGQPTITTGFLPTILSAAGVRALRGRELDVVNLVPFLSGCQTPFSRTLLWRSKHDKAIRIVVRDGDKKLLSEHGREKPHNLSIDGREENGLLPQAESVPHQAANDAEIVEVRSRRPESARLLVWKEQTLSQQELPYAQADGVRNDFSAGSSTT